MKQIIQKIWMFIAMLCFSSAASAYDFEVDGIYYNVLSLTNLTCEVTSGERFSYSGNVTIPETVMYKNKALTVESIGVGAFYECRNLTSVVIPNSVTSIGAGAFAECGVYGVYKDMFEEGAGLRSVNLGESVVTIGANAFYNCVQLRDINIPNSVTSIGSTAFMNCGLYSIRLSESLTTINDRTFERCSLKNITIPNSVTSIGEKAFYASSLISINIGDSVSSIGNDAFKNCGNLQHIEIGKSVKSIGDGAFRSCESLNSISIPNSVTKIGAYAFSDCTSLTSIIIPNSVTSIGEWAFKSCKLLEKIELSNQLKELNVGTFNGCESLSSITIPGSVAKVRWRSTNAYGDVLLFGNCTNLKELRFEYGDTQLELEYLCSAVHSYQYHTIYDLLKIEKLFVDRDIYYRSDTNYRSVGFEFLKELTLGSHIKIFPGAAIYNSDDLEVLTLYPINPPKTSGFSNSYYMNIIVKVPRPALEAYLQAPSWKDFWNIEAFDRINVDAEAVSLNFQKTELTIGDTFQLEAIILPEDASNKSVNWASTNPTVATVTATGEVEALSSAEATIIASTLDGSNLSASCHVTVVEKTIPVQSIELSYSKIEGTVNETFVIDATILPDNASKKALKWTSSNEAVATVEDGTVKLISLGTAIITAEATDGSNVSADCAVIGLTRSGLTR